MSVTRRPRPVPNAFLSPSGALVFITPSATASATSPKTRELRRIHEALLGRYKAADEKCKSAIFRVLEAYNRMPPKLRKRDKRRLRTAITQLLTLRAENLQKIDQLIQRPITEKTNDQFGNAVGLLESICPQQSQSLLDIVTGDRSVRVLRTPKKPKKRRFRR